MSDIIENIILLGVGGGAARFVSETVRKADVGMRAVVFDGDRSTAELCAPDVKFCLLGEGRLDGHGTGGQSIKGRAAVQDDAEFGRDSVLKRALRKALKQYRVCWEHR